MYATDFPLQPNPGSRQSSVVRVAGTLDIGRANQRYKSDNACTIGCQISYFIGIQSVVINLEVLHLAGPLAPVSILTGRAYLCGKTVSAE